MRCRIGHLEPPQCLEELLCVRRRHAQIMLLICSVRLWLKMNRPLLTFTRGSRAIYVVSSCFECKGKELFLYRKGLKGKVRKKIAGTWLAILERKSCVVMWWNSEKISFECQLYLCNLTLLLKHISPPLAEGRFSGQVISVENPNRTTQPLSLDIAKLLNFLWMTKRKLFFLHA